MYFFFIHEVVYLHTSRRSKHSKLDILPKETSLDLRLVKFANIQNRPLCYLEILKSISGKFCSGQLTAILGPSGAGKTTLLNILSGYIQTSEIEGVLEPRDRAFLNKVSTYIMQDNVIQPRLTVKEAMIFCARLKLGSHISYEDKIALVEELINLLGLNECKNTVSENLFGGQKKRLSIALELVDNPSIIFLDEPTTGLDNFSAKQCIQLLKQISQLNRTVICTIHQPPSSLFRYFDQIYVVADGICVYNDAPSHLDSFLSSNGHSCPTNNTPAEYIIELVHVTPCAINFFKNATNNGATAIENDENEDVSIFGNSSNGNEDIKIQKFDNEFLTSPSFQVQFSVLLSRMFLQLKRNKIAIYLMLIYHIVTALIIAGMFGRLGNNASQAFQIFLFCICANIFFLYTYLLIPVLVFPSEVTLLKMEYFNRWYTLKTYYFAMTVCSLLFSVVGGTIFSVIVYFLTDQPREMDRFLVFWTITLMVGLSSHGLGYIVGGICNVKLGAIIASIIMAVNMIISIQGLGSRGSIPFIPGIFMKISFLRYGIEGVCSAIFYKRDPLVCDQEFCYYSRPEILMRDNSVVLIRSEYYLCVLFTFCLVFRVVGYLVLKCRLKPEISSKIEYYFAKSVKSGRIK